MADLSFYTNRERGGCRGGQENFKWDSVKDQKYGDRECYLGASVNVGLMGQQGKFSKYDWWQHKRGAEDVNKFTENSEKKAVRDFEDELMKEALGLKPKKLLLQKKKLTAEEMKQIMENQDKSQAEAARGKIGGNREGEEDMIVGVTKGLGFAAHRTAELEAKKTALLGVADELAGTNTNEDGSAESKYEYVTAGEDITPKSQSTADTAQVTPQKLGKSEQELLMTSMSPKSQRKQEKKMKKKLKKDMKKAQKKEKKRVKKQEKKRKKEEKRAAAGKRRKEASSSDSDSDSDDDDSMSDVSVMS